MGVADGSRLSDYAYDLPEELIAQTPLADRAASRLLLLHRDSGEVEHLRFRDCVDLLSPGDLLVLNDTRVSALRLIGEKSTGGRVEALLLREVAHREYDALAKPGRSLRVGTELKFGDLEAEVTAVLHEGVRRIRFDARRDLKERLSEYGSVPLPPYIHARLEDAERYQTVYAQAAGSAAAPTAGLHFTPEILGALRAKGVQTSFVTLHVGMDTFRPVQVENLAEHRMHGEECAMPEDTAKAINECAGRIVAVGTTTVRTLESFATDVRAVAPGRMASSLFIRPGFEFRVIDGMFTNFHLPQTTMLAMISALAGRERVFEAYRQAVAEQYRFLSFGDSMLIL